MRKPRIIDIDSEGRPIKKTRTKRFFKWLKRSLDLVAKVMTAFAFFKNWGWKVFIAVFALGSAAAAVAAE